MILECSLRLQYIRDTHLQGYQRHLCSSSATFTKVLQFSSPYQWDLGATRWGKHDAFRFTDIIRNVSNYVENVSKVSRNALAWEMSRDELIFQQYQHIQDGGWNMYHLKKIAGMFTLLCTPRLLWNQLPRHLAFHSTIEIQVALHCHHVDERIKLRTIALAKYQWRIVFSLWFSKSQNIP